MKLKYCFFISIFIFCTFNSVHLLAQQRPQFEGGQENSCCSSLFFASGLGCFGAAAAMAKKSQDLKNSDPDASIGWQLGALVATAAGIQSWRLSNKIKQD